MIILICHELYNSRYRGRFIFRHLKNSLKFSVKSWKFHRKCLHIYVNSFGFVKIVLKSCENTVTIMKTQYFDGKTGGALYKNKSCFWTGRRSLDSCVCRHTAKDRHLLKTSSVPKIPNQLAIKGRIWVTDRPLLSKNPIWSSNFHFRRQLRILLGWAVSIVMNLSISCDLTLFS